MRVQLVASTQASAAVNGQCQQRSSCPGCQERDALIAKLRQQLRHCREQLRQLRDANGRNSTNSSIPPSQNPLQAPKPKTAKKPSGRRPGGQPGHADTSPGIIPPELVTEPPIVCVPPTCRHCQAPLTNCDDLVAIHQVVELPPIVPEVREYHCHSSTCEQCGQNTTAALPDGVPSGGYGPRLQAFIGLCTGRYHLSKRQVEEFLNTTFNIPISLGTICNIEQRVSEAIAEPVAEAKQSLQEADVVYADETSWRQQPHKGWLWAGLTACLAVFSIRDRRDRTSAEDLLGPHFRGVLVSDRLGSYHWVQRRQLCWAHLRRDWQAFIDRGGGSRRLGRQLMQLTDHLFQRWHRVRAGTLSRQLFRMEMIGIRAEVGGCLRTGLRCAQPRTAGTCAAILDHEAQLWTFLFVDGVEPTNNAAERILRQAVLWRKKSFGTRSRRGSRYVERVLSVVATCRLQGRNVLEYLTAACAAAIRGRPAPSLLPGQTRL
jgi:transposase